MKLILAAAWKTFEAAVVPSDASTVARHNMKLSFYAGAIAVSGEVLNHGRDLKVLAVEAQEFVQNAERHQRV